MRREHGRWRTAGWAAAVLLVVGAAATLAVHRLRADPAVVMLVSGDGADWVRVDRPFRMWLWTRPAEPADVETTVTVPPRFAGATLSVTALRAVAVWLDDVRVLDTGPPDDRSTDWKTARSVPLPATLGTGPHRLRLRVTNRNGPALVRASCGALDVHTGHGQWRATAGAGRGSRVCRAADPWRPAITDLYGPTLPVLIRRAPILLSVFAAAALATLCWPARSPATDWGRRARWSVLAAWVVLGAVDLHRLPLNFGYDNRAHYEYIRFVADHVRLPPPDAGLQFFQAPLYYVVSAALWRGLAAAGVAAAELPYLMRCVPLACGAGLAEVCYRTARHAFPGRGDLHAVAVVVGGLMPVNLYMGLVVGNEPMAGCLGGMVAAVGTRLLARPADADDPRWSAAAGGLLGLAFLCKASLALWAIPLAAAAAVRRPPGRVAVATRNVCVTAAVAAAVAAPHVVRTWRVAGVPVLARGYVRGSTWWQDPGYRTPRQLLTFGRGLTRVALGGIDGLWDSLYSTIWGNGYLSGMIDDRHVSPWHWDMMACGLWLALVPVAAMALGAAAGRPRGGVWFPLLAIGTFLAAVVWVYLTLPIYACAKGSYLLSTLPCMATLAAAGFDRVMIGRWSRAVVVGLLTCWAGASYGTYLITG